MAIDKTEVLASIKTRLSLSDDTSKDSILNDYISEYENKILNYCNISAVPDGLYYTLVSMVISAYKYDNDEDKVTSMTKGDTSFKYGSSNLSKASGGILKNYKADLNRYRRIKVR